MTRREQILGAACAVVLLAGSSAMAQGSGGGMQMNDGQGPHGKGKSGSSMRGNYGSAWKTEMYLMRAATQKKVATELGITDEQRSVLQEAMYDFREKQVALNAKIELAGIKEARILTSKTEIDEKALMKAIDEKYDAIKEQAKLKIKMIVLVKQTLSEEQIEKASELMAERMKKRWSKKGKGKKSRKNKTNTDDDTIISTPNTE